MDAELIITEEELESPDLEEQVQTDRSLEDMARASRSIIYTPPQRNPLVYYPIGAAVGTTMAWGLVEIADNLVNLPNVPVWDEAALYVLAGSLTAVWIGLLYGLIHGNPQRAVRCASTGLLVVILPAFFMGGIAEGVSWLLVDLPLAWSTPADGYGGLSANKGLGLGLSMMSHGFGWSLVMLSAAIGPGLAIKSPRLIHNGAVGGLLGGALGGALWPVWPVILPDAIVMPHVIGMSAIGFAVGLGFGIMHYATREAWFVLAKGKLYGKRLLLIKDRMTIGNSAQADIGLHGDSLVEPIHATMEKKGLRWLITDHDSEAGTFVNGHKIERCLLTADDVVTMGETVLKFKQRKPMK